MTKTHWLYGRGPDHILDFKREIDEETDCSKCIHREVCDRNMEKRCENYEFGTSAERSCQSCLHKYTRYDKDAVPCFSCPWFENAMPEHAMPEHAMYLPVDCPICGRRRLELIDGGKIVRCEKCMTASQWEWFTSASYGKFSPHKSKARAITSAATEKNQPNDQPNAELVGRRFRALDRPGHVVVVLQVKGDLAPRFSCGVRVMYRFEGPPSAARYYASQRRFLKCFRLIDETSVGAS